MTDKGKVTAYTNPKGAVVKRTASKKTTKKEESSRECGEADCACKSDAGKYFWLKTKVFFTKPFSCSGAVSIRRDQFFLPTVRVKRYKVGVGSGYGLHLIVGPFFAGLRVWKSR